VFTFKHTIHRYAIAKTVAEVLTLLLDCDEWNFDQNFRNFECRERKICGNFFALLAKRKLQGCSLKEEKGRQLPPNSPLTLLHIALHPSLSPSSSITASWWPISGIRITPSTTTLAINL
jgi:hypothetical protein